MSDYWWLLDPQNTTTTNFISFIEKCWNRCFLVLSLLQLTPMLCLNRHKNKIIIMVIIIMAGPPSGVISHAMLTYRCVGRRFLAEAVEAESSKLIDFVTKFFVCVADIAANSVRFCKKKHSTHLIRCLPIVKIQCINISALTFNVLQWRPIVFHCHLHVNCVFAMYDPKLDEWSRQIMRFASYISRGSSQ